MPRKAALPPTALAALADADQLASMTPAQLDAMTLERMRLVDEACARLGAEAGFEEYNNDPSLARALREHHVRAGEWPVSTPIAGAS